MTPDNKGIGGKRVFRFEVGEEGTTVSVPEESIAPIATRKGKEQKRKETQVAPTKPTPHKGGTKQEGQ